MSGYDDPRNSRRGSGGYDNNSAGDRGSRIIINEAYNPESGAYDAYNQPFDQAQTPEEHAIDRDEPPADYHGDDGRAGTDLDLNLDLHYLQNSSNSNAGDFHDIRNINNISDVANNNNMQDNSNHVVHSMEEGSRVPGGGTDHVDGHRRGRSDFHGIAQTKVLAHSNIARHRRAKSHHARNGYEFYQQQQHQQHVNHGFEGDEDDDVEQSFDMDDLRRARRVLATLRIKKKSRRKSSTKKHSVRPDDPAVDYAQGEEEEGEEEEEEVGLPSARGREKMKGLSQRLVLARSLARMKSATTWDMAAGYR